MSLGEADAKYPNQSSDALPPSPSRENPGQVYPKSDPQAAPQQSVPGTGGGHEPSAVIGNPYALQDAFAKLDQALGELISTIGGEEASMGSAPNEDAMLQKFKAWRTELDQMRAGSSRSGGRRAGTPQEGGMFTD